MSTFSSFWSRTYFARITIYISLQIYVLLSWKFRCCFAEWSKVSPREFDVFEWYRLLCLCHLFYVFQLNMKVDSWCK